jgi:hypothetical protein
MKYRKMNKYEKKAWKHEKLEDDMSGNGLYLYENHSEADLSLPRPTKSGLRSVGPKSQFQGDDYYMQLVRNGHLRLIKVLQTPEQEQALQEATVEQERLILDQPETITEHGEIEHVINTNTPVQKLHEGGDQPQPDVLLNEGPVDDGFVIVE